MRVGAYKLRLLAVENDEPLTEYVIDRDTIAGAEPETVFCIGVAVHPNVSGGFPGATLLAEVSIDGIHVTSRWLDTTGRNAPVRAFINGFRKSEQHTALFVMSVPKAKDAKVNANGKEERVRNSGLGSIKVNFYLGERVLRRAEKWTGKYNPGPSKAVDPEAKFWQRASLITNPGAELTKPLPHYEPGTTIERVRKIALDATLVLKYHTTQTITALQEIAAHRAQRNALTSKLIDHHGRLVIDLTQDDDTDSDTISPPPKPTNMPVLRGVKREREAMSQIPVFRPKYA